MKKLSALLVSAVLLISLVACSSDRFMKENEIKKLEKNPTGTINISYLPKLDGERQIISLNFELFYDKAPITVTNFVSLVNSGFYNDVFLNNDSISAAALSSLSFLGSYEVEEDGETVTKQKTLDYTIKGEFKSNDWILNDVDHIDWTFSMIREEENKDSADFKFMILLDSNKTRNNDNAGFARVLSGKGQQDLLDVLSDTDIIKPSFKIESIKMDEGTPELGKVFKIKK